MVEVTSTTSFLPTTIICSIPSAQCATIISLLYEDYSVHQLQSKTGVGKSTIGRIKKEANLDKENNKGGLLRLQRALIVRLVLRVDWWRVLEGVEESLALLETT